MAVIVIFIRQKMPKEIGSTDFPDQRRKNDIKIRFCCCFVRRKLLKHVRGVTALVGNDGKMT